MAGDSTQSLEDQRHPLRSAVSGRPAVGTAQDRSRPDREAVRGCGIALARPQSAIRRGILQSFATSPDCRVSYNSSKSPTSCGDPSNGGLSMKIGAPLRRDRVVLRGCTRSRTWEPGTVLCEHRDGRRWLLGAHRAPYPPRSRLLVRPSSPATHRPRSGSLASVTCHDPCRGSVRSMDRSIRGV